MAQDTPPQPPAPQTPATPQQPPATPQQPAPDQPPADPQARNMRLPPPPPKVVDVRMPGEAGWFIGLTGWLPIGKPTLDKGKEAAYTASSLFQLPGTSKGAPGAELGFAAGLHNSLRFSYMYDKAAGNSVAANDVVLFSQLYLKGEKISSSYKLQNYKLSYEYLTWPYPVENRHFRLKTLWQVQYVTFRSNYDNPVKSNTADAAGNLTSYEATGSKSYFTPTFGLGIHEYATRNIRFEANISGFGFPHRFSLVDGDAAVAVRLGKIEIRGGAKALRFRSSARSDYYFYGTMGGAFVGLRWYSD